MPSKCKVVSFSLGHSGVFCVRCLLPCSSFENWTSFHQYSKNTCILIIKYKFYNLVYFCGFVQSWRWAIHAITRELLYIDMKHMLVWILYCYWPDVSSHSSQSDFLLKSYETIFNLCIGASSVWDRDRIRLAANRALVHCTCTTHC